eukprot:scaffold182589_cov35-Tisochrysis_lutea.AAC.2
MLFMLGSMTATRREQQRRWMAMHGYALHGYDEVGMPLRYYHGGYYGDLNYHGGRGGSSAAAALEADEEAFWAEFEAGRRGQLGPSSGSRHSLLLSVLALDQILSRLRDDNESEGEEQSDSEGDDEVQEERYSFSYPATGTAGSQSQASQSPRA